MDKKENGRALTDKRRDANRKLLAGKNIKVMEFL